MTVPTKCERFGCESRIIFEVEPSSVPVETAIAPTPRKSFALSGYLAAIFSVVMSKVLLLLAVVLQLDHGWGTYLNLFFLMGLVLTFLPGILGMIWSVQRKAIGAAIANGVGLALTFSNVMALTIMLV